MIDFGMTNLNTQPGVADKPQPVQPVEPVKPVQPAQTQADQQQNATNKEGIASSLDVNRFASPKDTSLQFRIDRDYDRLVVSILDEEGEVVRQVPSELMLKIADRIKEIQEQGNLGLNERV